LKKSDKTIIPNKPLRLWSYAFAIICIWTLFILISWIWLTQVIRSGTLETARIEARTAFRNDVIYRQWNADHGGLYAPVTPETPPNPYLKTDHREIQTPAGILLTKINPAYMTRQVHELTGKTYGHKGHITSLNPIRPQNAPDPWEKQALNRFEQGETEVSSMEIMDKTKYLRLMSPLITEKGCLDCHADQGYKIGEIRGGISISIPMAPHETIERANVTTLRLIYVFLWIIGVSATLLGIFFLNRQIQKRHQAEDLLRQHEKMEGVMEMAGAVCHELNQPLQTILGNSEIMLLDLAPDHPLSKRLNNIQEQVERMSKTTRNLIKITRYETKQFPQGMVIDIDRAAKEGNASKKDNAPK
jgi:hypothetical protein